MSCNPTFIVHVFFVIFCHLLHVVLNSLAPKRQKIFGFSWSALIMVIFMIASVRQGVYLQILS